MPEPGPLGHLVRHRRENLGLTQQRLSDVTAQQGLREPQNTVSRLESGRTHRMHNADYVRALVKALDYENDDAFILAAWSPKSPQKEHGLSSPEDTIIEVIREWPEHEKWRAVRVVTALPDPPNRNRRK